MIKGVRALTLAYLEFEYCNVYRGTYGKSLPLIHRHPDAIVILWNKGDHHHVFFLTMSQLFPCLKDMQANWSMIVSGMKQKVQLRVRGRMLDFTSRISQHLLLTRRRNRRQVKMKWTIQVTMIHMAICQWTMRICRRLRANTRNRISTMILLSGTQAVILRRSLPEAALRCRHRADETGNNPPPGSLTVCANQNHRV